MKKILGIQEGIIFVYILSSRLLENAVFRSRDDIYRSSLYAFDTHIINEQQILFFVSLSKKTALTENNCSAIVD